MVVGNHSLISTNHVTKGFGNKSRIKVPSCLLKFQNANRGTMVVSLLMYDLGFTSIELINIHQK
jgi:hypothetical protein